MKYLFFMSIVFFMPFGILSQNLVPNGDFEEYDKCPETISPYYGWKDSPKFWFNSVCGSPDYYNKCSSNSYIKNANPRSGRACVGILTFFASDGICREYVSVELKSPLITGEMYCVKFYVALRASSNMVSSYIGALLSQTPIVVSPLIKDPPYTPQIVNREMFLSDTVWTEISGIYTAQGGEKTITIGNFTGLDETGGCYRSLETQKSEKPSGLTSASYYFVDDVSIIPVKNEFECFPVGGSFLLDSIFFDAGESKLLPTSFKELDKLAAYLTDHPDILIEISGHTDSLGNSSANVKLSTARAKAVLDYLISMGISRKRITYKGYGSVRPVASNLTEKGRQKNRRVEVVLSKK